MKQETIFYGGGTSNSTAKRTEESNLVEVEVGLVLILIKRFRLGRLTLYLLFVRPKS